jgi:hypothetical protein
MRMRVRDAVAALLAAVPAVGGAWMLSFLAPGLGVLWVLNGYVAVSSALLALAFLLWRSGRDPAMPGLGEVGIRAVRALLAAFVAGSLVSGVFLATEVMSRTESAPGYPEDVQEFGATDNLGAAAFMWGLALGLLTPLPPGPWRVWAVLRALPFGAFAAYALHNIEEASQRASGGAEGAALAAGAALALLLLPLRFWRFRRAPPRPTDAAAPAMA